MGELLDRSNEYSWEDVNYGDMEQLKEKLLYKRIVEWDEDKLVLDDGTIVTLEMSESDCCAGADGKFSDVELDAVITDLNVGDMVDIPNDYTNVSRSTLTIFHNQNPIAQGEMEADAGNGGYYYSVGSIVIDEIHFPIVEA